MLITVQENAQIGTLAATITSESYRTQRVKAKEKENPKEKGKPKTVEKAVVKAKAKVKVKVKEKPNQRRSLNQYIKKQEKTDEGQRAQAEARITQVLHNDHAARSQYKKSKGHKNNFEASPKMDGQIAQFASYT